MQLDLDLSLLFVVGDITIRSGVQRCDKDKERKGKERKGKETVIEGEFVDDNVILLELVLVDSVCEDRLGRKLLFD